MTAHLERLNPAEGGPPCARYSEETEDLSGFARWGGTGAPGGPLGHAMLKG